MTIKSNKKYQGFTLIEMLVTLVIIGILSTVALPLIQVTYQRTKEQELRTDLRQIRQALDDYKQAADDGKINKSPYESGYPKTLDDLVNGADNIKDPKKGKIYFLRRIPRDPFFEDTDTPASETWGIRSYQSAYDAPSEGDDVFDVYSTAKGVGLNGIPYKEW